MAVKDPEARVEIVCIGTRPMLMHNGDLADPLNEYTREIKRLSAKRNKTAEDYEIIAQLEIKGSLYYVEPLGPCIPRHVLTGCLIAGARKIKEGSNTRLAVLVEEDNCPLMYEGPRELDAIATDPKLRHTQTLPVSKTNKSRIRRVWPKFAEGWMFRAHVLINRDFMDLDVFEQVLQRAGRLCGLGDFHPTYGLFSSEVKLLRA